jgi:hypothetical protein
MSVSFPWRVNGHAATKQLAVTGLQLWVNSVVDHHRRQRIWWLRLMPFSFSTIKLGR